jgi:hypothetical protein
MVIEFVSADEVRTGRGGKGNGVKYKAYSEALAPLVSSLKEQIEKNKEGIIRIKNKDLAKEMGGTFAKKNATSIYWGTKYSLFREGIVVSTGTHRDGDKILTMRMKVEGDVLPNSLEKIGKKSEDSSISKGDLEQEQEQEQEYEQEQEQEPEE